jgi:hypothetical protein
VGPTSKKWAIDDFQMKTSSPSHEYTFDRLDALRVAWSNADAPPPEVEVLSSGEYVALAVACGYERVLRNPVVGFLLLDGWLQGWVMRHRGMAHLIGTRVGVDESP